MSTADVTIGVEDNLQHTWKLLDKSIWCESYRRTKRSRLLTDSKRCSAKMYELVYSLVCNIHCLWYNVLALFVLQEISPGNGTTVDREIFVCRNFCLLNFRH